jgi:hypothetical protein
MLLIKPWPRAPLLPPEYALDGKFRRVVIHSHTNPARVPSQVIPLGAIVGGFNARMQEAQHVSSIMLLAGSVEQPLIVRIAEHQPGIAIAINPEYARVRITFVFVLSVSGVCCYFPSTEKASSTLPGIPPH